MKSATGSSKCAVFRPSMYERQNTSIELMVWDRRHE
jgi:hypothetical protein